MGPIHLCPVEVFQLLRGRTISAGKPHVVQCDSSANLGRRTAELFRRASEERVVAGRRRALYTMHSTRVTAVSYLLKAGLSEKIILVLCNWSSDQVLHYGRRLALDPGVVGLWPFYNPESIAEVYAGGGPGRGAAGRKRKRSKGG